MNSLLLRIFDGFDVFQLFNRFTKNKAAVFMLHHFCGPGVQDYRSLRADALERCLRYIVKHEYNTLSLSEFVDALGRRQSLYKTVVFTVDDGYRDFLQHGFPVFAKYNIPVAVFITTGFIDGRFSFWWDDIRRIIDQIKLSELEVLVGGRTIGGPTATADDKESLLHRIIEQAKQLPREEINAVIAELGRLCGCGQTQNGNDALSWAEISELTAKGVEFYPHTCTHPILSQSTDDQVQKEIFKSKETVAAYLNTPANIFCYPNGRYGDFDQRALEALKNAGYAAAFTSEEGFDTSVGALDMYQLHRYSLFNDTIRFKQIVSGLEAAKIAVRSWAGK